MERILVAVDGSLGGLKAVDFAAELAGRYNAELILLAVARHAVPVFDAAAAEFARIEHSREPPGESGVAAAEAVLSGARIEAWANGAVRLSSVTAFGDPADEIVRCADDRRADLVVLGSSSHGRLERLFHGSVVQKVLALAPCTVAVAR